MTSNINTGHAKGKRSVKKGHAPSNPEPAPVTVAWFDPRAMVRARQIVADASNSYTVARIEDGEVWVR